MRLRTTLVIGVVAVLFSAPAYAQILGTFSWQTQPFCNVVSVTVIQQGGTYQLAGTDSLCGTGTAAVTGTAALGGGGVVMGFTVALPSGRAAHISATLNLSTLSGTWLDADGNTGPFAFAANAGGSARPTPTSSAVITVTQIAPSVYGGNGTATTLARSDHNHDSRYFTKTELAGLSAAVRGGNGEGVGGSICAGGVGIEIFITNSLGAPVDHRFSFIVPEFSYGQIRSDGSVRTSKPGNALTVQHPSTGAYCLVFTVAATQAQSEATLVSIHAEQ
jgi:hypothetical protein